MSINDIMEEKNTIYQVVVAGKLYLSLQPAPHKPREHVDTSAALIRGVQENGTGIILPIN